jgi:REP element-mobilizing transposase RayT
MQLFAMLDRMIGMARRPRIHYPGAIYHAMSRGVDGRAIFADDRDRSRFLDGMRRIELQTGSEVIAYCLMGNHYHLAIKVRSTPLGAVIQRMESGYCAAFNRRNGRTGHLFQARYEAKICLNELYLATVIHYIHQNPVRAKLVAAAGDWPWSSFKPGEPVYDLTGFDPWEKPAAGALLRGSPSGTADLEAIGASTAAWTGIDLEALRSECRGRAVVAARRLFVQAAIREGSTLIAAAKWLNTTKSSVSRYAQDNTATTGGLTPFLPLG